jgi:hypothetical protein
MTANTIAPAISNIVAADGRVRRETTAMASA